MPIDLMPQLVSAAIRAFGLGLVAFVGLLLFRVRSSSARHAVWTVVLVGMLLQIPLGVPVEVNMFPTVPLPALPTLPAPAQTRVTASARISVLRAPQSPASASLTRSEPNSGGALSQRDAHRRIPRRSRCCSLLRMALGYRWPAPNPARRQSGSPAWVMASWNRPYSQVPGSVGCFRARIVLPRGWRDWDAVKLRAVLAHERAHLRRRDWLNPCWPRTSMFASSGFILWPGGCRANWHGWRRKLVTTSLFRRSTTKREDYAAALVDIARRGRGRKSRASVLNWRVISDGRGDSKCRAKSESNSRRDASGPEAIGASRLGDALCVQLAGHLFVRGSNACPCKSGFKRVGARCRSGPSAGTESRGDIDRASGSESTPPDPD